jgi:hypothetical protein
MSAFDIREAPPISSGLGVTAAICPPGWHTIRVVQRRAESDG